jgi:streptogramin lyase
MNIRGRKILLILALGLIGFPQLAAAQTARFSYAQLTLGGGFSGPNGVAVDANGNVFVADTINNGVKEIPAGCASAGCVITLGSGFSAPSGVAVDSNENVYVADTGNSAVKEILAAGGYVTVNTLGNGFSHPAGVAVDVNANVYVADTANNAVKQILAAGGYVTVNTLGGGFSAPDGVALDANANVYVADSGNSAVKEISASSGYTEVNTLGGGFVTPKGVAVDLAGNVFVANFATNAVQEIPPGCVSSACVQTLSSDFSAPFALAVDAHDALYIADSGNNRVVKQEIIAVDFGTLNIGQSTSSTTLTFTFQAGVTLGSPLVLTEGAANLDFANAGTGSCTTGAAFIAGNTCTVNATFTPKVAGFRSGAVVLQDNSGNTIATAYLRGSGTGPQVAFLPFNQITLGGGFSIPNGLTVDGAGNVFVANFSNHTVQESPAGCVASGCVVTLASNFIQPASVAVDGGGNVFVADSGESVIKEIPRGCASNACVVTIGSGFLTPFGVATDAIGNVFVADTGNSAVKEIIAAGGFATINTLGSGFNAPQGIAVDANGNVFVADSANNAVKEILAAGGYVTVNTLASGFKGPTEVAVDGSGNVYVADYNNLALKKILASGGYTTVITLEVFNGPTAISPYPANGVAVDGLGNVYTAVPGVSRISKLDYADPPALTFPTTTTVGVTDTLDGLLTITLQNIGNATLNVTAFTLPGANFNTSSGTTCSSPSAITPGNSCTVGATFTPTSPGTLTGNVTWTDNALNAPGSIQTASFSGTAETAAPPPAPNITSGPANPTSANTATFVFTDSQSSATFVCSLDAAAYTACTSPTAYASLALTAHTFSVKAEDALGNLSSATTYNWSATAPPPPSIDAAPANPTLATTASFNFSDTQSPVTFQCSLDSASFTACTSGISYSSLATGPHVFAVQAKNGLGNLSTAASYSWTISTVLNLQTASTENFGTVPVGQTSAAITLTYTFTASETLGTPVALTLGVTGLDFALTNTGTCKSGSSFISGNTCTLTVTFAPKFAGTRNGAVLLKDGSGNTIVMGYVHGIGSAPQVRFFFGSENTPSNITTLGGNFNNPNGIALDGAGNIYVADYGNNAVEQVPPGCVTSSCIVPIGGGFTDPRGVAVDGAGNVFVADWGNFAVKEIPPGCVASACVKTLSSGVFTPYSVAVDGSGNLFMADLGDNEVRELLAAGGYVTDNILGSGFTQPEDVAVDGYGNAFVVETGIAAGSSCAGICFSNTPALSEILAAGGYTTVNTLANGFNAPIFVTVDGTGNVYVSEILNSGIYDVLAYSNYTLAESLDIIPGLLQPSRAGAAVDGPGNVYIATSAALGFPNSLQKLDYVDPPSLNFPTPTVVGTTDLADGDIGFTFQNNGNTALTVTSIVTSANFTVDAAQSNCSTTVPLAPGVPCVINVLFTPTSGNSTGTDTGTVTITDNALNAAGTTQVVNLSGVTTPPAPSILTGPANPTSATSATFTFSDAQSGVTFLCGLDGVYSVCSSGVVFPAVANGPHVFEVYATDSQGYDSTAATYPWTVNTIAPPAPTILTGPAAQTNETTAALTFSDTQAGVTFQCSIDGVSYVACTSGVNYSSLAAGPHTFTVEAKDSSNNVSPPAAYNWTVVAVVMPGAFGPEDFGTVAVGQTSAPVTITFTFTAAATIGAPAALTQGATGLDFNVVSGGTCVSGNSYAIGNTCTLVATFSPKFAGLRMGAVVLPNNSGTSIFTVFVHGIGSGPQIGFLPYTLSTLGGGLFAPEGVVADSSGNVFVADTFNASLKKIPPGCAATSCIVTLPGGFGIGYGIAMDGAGNLWVPYEFTNSFFELLAAGGYTTTGSGLNFSSFAMYPDGMAVDGSGNVYEVDLLAHPVSEYIASANYIPSNINLIKKLGHNFNGASGVAVDSAGNVFVADAGDNAVVEIPAAGGGTTVIPLGSGFNRPTGVAVDANDNVFVADSGNEAVKEILAAGGYTTVVTIASNIEAGAIALDGAGNIYVPSELNIQKLGFANAPSLNFPTATLVGTTDTTDGTLTVTIKNSGNSPLTLSAITPSMNFTINSGATTCSTSAPLAPSSSCVVGVEFSPTVGGNLTGTLTLTDNTLNVAGTMQVVNLSGVTLPPAPSISSGPANPASVATATFAFTDTQAGVTFLCKVDSEVYAACSSGVGYFSLMNGAHTFSVEAQDSVGVSTPATYLWTVTLAGPPPPVITSLVPPSAVAGSSGFSLTVNGSGFVNGATATFGGASRVVTFVNSGQITIAVLTSDLVSVGTPAVIVTNPAGGGSSNSVNFSVTAVPLVPTITAVMSNNNPSILGQSVMFTASVTPQSDPIPLPSGTVTFKDGTITLGTGTLSSGTATLTTSLLAPGSHSITAVYGGDSNYSGSTSIAISQVVNNPVPVIIPPLVPASIIAGSAGFTLTVNGSGFVNGATATFGGTGRSVTFVNSGQVTIAVQTADVATAGAPAVIVTNPGPGGGASNSVNFAVNNPIPAITSISPTTVSANSGQFTLTVNGSGFISSSTVDWIGSPQATTFVSATKLTAIITNAEIQSANPSVPVIVVNQAPGGGTSNTEFFNVTTAVPTLASLVPNSAIAGGPQFTLTVNGSNFLSNAEVEWNGSERSTTFVNAGQLTATITMADIQTAGTASVTVFNPMAIPGVVSAAIPLGAPAGTTSNPLTFTINAANPLPTLTSLSPNTTAAGGSAFTLTISGTNFIGSTTAQWNGSPRSTTFVSSTQVTAAITAADIASMGTAPVTVVNPTPGGGTSNALTFTITDFSVANTSGSKTVTAGQVAMYTINAAGLGGNFPGTVTFSASGLPAATTASFNPPTAAPGAGTVPTTLTLTTTARATTAHIVPLAPRSGPNHSPLLPQLLLWLGVMTLLGITLLLLQRAEKLKPRMATTAFVVLAAICVAGFAGGCNGGYPADITVPAGTPAGTYTITVTGTSGSVQHSTTVSLTVD